MVMLCEAGRIMGLLGSLNMVLMGDLAEHEVCAGPDTKVEMVGLEPVTWRLEL